MIFTKTKPIQQHKYLLESGLFTHKVVEDKRRKEQVKRVPKNKLLQEAWDGREEINEELR